MLMISKVDQKLIAKLEELATRAESLTAQLSDPSIAVDPNKRIPSTKVLGRSRRQ